MGDKSFERAAASSSAKNDEQDMLAQINAEVYPGPKSDANSKVIDGVEHFPELDKRATAIVQDLLKMSPPDALDAFTKLNGDETLQKYNSHQVAGAFSEAQKQLDPTMRFEFWSSSSGNVTMYDAENPRREEITLSDSQMYTEAELAALKAKDAYPDEDKTAEIARAFAANDLANMTPEQLAATFSESVKEMKTTGATPRFAATEFSNALEKAGLKYEVDRKDGNLLLRTVEDQPRATITVAKGS